MTAEQTMLRAIFDAPSDDVPRRIYADWLLDRGDPRGELIHLQCELASLASTDPRRAAIRERELDLLREHHVRWGPFNDSRFSWAFERGFVSGFGHQGVFHHTGDGDGTSDTWVRFFPDRTVLYIVTGTGGSADVVANWFEKGQQFSTHLTYTVNPDHDGIRLRITATGNQNEFTAAVTTHSLDLQLTEGHASTIRLFLEGTKADSRYSWPTT